MNKYKELFLTTTDTVVGMGAPINKENEKAIYDLKQRDPKKPLIIMIGNIEQARSFKEWSSKAEELAKEVWPGQTTLVISPRVALRIPDVKELRDLLGGLGPCYMTSANFSGGPELSLDEARNAFQEITTYYNFGKGNGKASTIIDVETGKVLR